MKASLPAAVQTIAGFLGIELDKVVLWCSLVTSV